MKRNKAGQVKASLSSSTPSKGSSSTSGGAVGAADNGMGSPAPMGSPIPKPKSSKSKSDKHKSKKRSRSPYKCNKCGKLKKGHICTAATKVPTKLMEAKAPMPVSPVISDQTQADYFDGTTSTVANTFFNATPISDEFLAYSSNNFPTSYSLTDYSTGMPDSSLDLTHLAYGEGELPIGGPGIGLDKTKVPFFSSWFDMAKNGIEMLLTFLNTQKPSWDILQEVILSLEEDKKKIEDWKQRFSEEVIKKVTPVEQTSANEEDPSGFNTFGEEDSGTQDSLKEDFISSQPLKRRRLSFGPTGGSQNSESSMDIQEEHSEENVEISNFKEMDSQEGLDSESSVKTDT